MKGSALPMETIVAMVLAVIVLAAVLLFFFGTFTPATEEVKARQTVASICGEYSLSVQCRSVNEFIGREGLVGPLAPSDSQDKLVRLSGACHATGVSQCSAAGLPDDNCLKVCCSVFCPSSSGSKTTTTA